MSDDRQRRKAAQGDILNKLRDTQLKKGENEGSKKEKKARRK